MATGVVRVEDLLGRLQPRSRQHLRRSLVRQALARARELKEALGPIEAAWEVIYPGGDPARAETYVGLPVPQGFRRHHRTGDGHAERFVIPNLGPEEIEPNLEDYLEAQNLEEEAPPLRRADAVEAWVSAAASREREFGKVFGAIGPFVLADVELERDEWYGGYATCVPKDPDGAHAYFTSGLSDMDLTGTPTRGTRDYELYLLAPAGSARWAVGLLAHLVRAVVRETEDHLAAVRGSRYVVLPALSLPGLDGVWGAILGVRTNLPRALPIAGGGAKLIPVTLIHPAEVEHGEREGFEELAALLVEEGVSVVSDPRRSAVGGRGAKRGWRFW